MNKEFIPYEQALALKELGFNEPCFGYYNYNGSHFFKFKPRTDDKNLTKAPLYQQAFRWFRERYNLNCWCQNGTSSWLAYIGNVPGFVPYSDEVGGTDKFGGFAIHEEAELECLDKLIEIVKHEQSK